MLVTHEEAVQIAADWVDLWNNHNPEGLRELYSLGVIYYSPLARNAPKGQEHMAANGTRLIEYFRQCMQENPEWHAHIDQIFTGKDSLTFVYKGFDQAECVEFMILDKQRRIHRAYLNLLTN